MDLRKLLHATVVAREGSFSKAAATIPMSQSALTRSVQSLEREFGIVIFERGRNGARLTVDGAKFIATAEEILWSIDRAQDRLSEAANGAKGTVRLGVGPAMTAFILPRILRDLAQFPFHYDLRSGSNAGLRSLLSIGEIDFYVGGVMQLSEQSGNEAFAVEPLIPGASKLRITIRAGHPLAKADLTAENLRAFPVACESFIRDQIGRNGFDECGLPQPIFEVDDYHTLSSLLMQSDFLLVSTWNPTSLHPEGVLVTRDLRGPEAMKNWQWGFISNSRIPLSSNSLRIMDLIRTVGLAHRAEIIEGEQLV